MLQKLKMTLLSLSALFMFATPVAVAAGTAYAQNVNNNLNCGSNLDVSGSKNCASINGTKTNNGINATIKTALNILSIAVGAVAVVMIIIGGFRYTASGGKQESVSGAKNAILYALIGLVIVALAQIIVHFVLNRLTNATNGTVT